MQAHRHGGQNSEVKIQWIYCIFAQVCVPIACKIQLILMEMVYSYVDDEFILCCNCRFGIEGPVYLTQRGEKGGGEWFVDEQQQKIKKMDGSHSYSVLQAIRIHLEVVEPQPNRPKLQLSLL